MALWSSAVMLVALLALGAVAHHVQGQGVVLQCVAPLLGDGLLAAFNLGVVELLDTAARHADHVVVVLAFVQLEDSLAGLEVVAAEDAGLLELHQHTVDRGQTDVRAFIEQDLEDIFRCHVPLARLLEDFQDLDAGQRGLQTAVFEFFGVVHDGSRKSKRSPRVAR